MFRGGNKCSVGETKCSVGETKCYMGDTKIEKKAPAVIKCSRRLFNAYFLIMNPEFVHMVILEFPTPYSLLPIPHS